MFWEIVNLCVVWHMFHGWRCLCSCNLALCRNGTWCICWSPSNEYQLFSGDGSGAVRLWDIRRSGCRALLDYNTTQRPRLAAPAAPHRLAHHNTSGRKRNRTRDLPHAPEPGFGGEDGPNSRNTATGAALAHEGAVTALLATQDGLNLVTAGTDHRMRLWDACESYTCMLLGCMLLPLWKFPTPNTKACMRCQPS